MIILHQEKLLMDKNHRILVVDDESVLCDVLKINLELAGFVVDTALSAEAALEMNLESYDILILDVMMDKMNGFELAKTIRSDQALANIPIIFCTALDSEADLLKGFGVGGDDYVRKPFSMNELIVRVKSVLRRIDKSEKSEKVEIKYKGLVINKNERSLSVDGDDVPLTKKEFDLLWFMMSNAEQIFTRDALLAAVWEEDVLVVDRTIDVNINRLRKKLGRYGTCITTKSGYGYGFKSAE